MIELSKRSLKSIQLSSLRHISVGITQILIMYLLIDALGNAEFGSFIVFQTLAVFLNVALYFGVNPVCVVFSGKYKNQSPYINSYIILVLLNMIIVCTILNFFEFTILRVTLGYSFYYYIISGYIFSVLCAFCQGYRKFTLWNSMITLQQVVYLSWLFYRKDSIVDSEQVLLISGTSQVFISAVLLVKLRYQLKLIKWSRKKLWFFLNFVFN